MDGQAPIARRTLRELAGIGRRPRRDRRAPPTTMLVALLAVVAALAYALIERAVLS